MIILLFDSIALQQKYQILNINHNNNFILFLFDLLNILRLYFIPDNKWAVLAVEEKPKPDLKQQKQPNVIHYLI